MPGAETIQAVDALTQTIGASWGAWSLLIVGALVIVGYFQIRSHNRVVEGLNRNASDDNKRVDALSQLLAQQISINERHQERMTKVEDALATLTELLDRTQGNYTQIQQQMLQGLGELNRNFNSWPSLLDADLDQVRSTLVALTNRIGKMEDALGQINTALDATPGDTRHREVTGLLLRLVALSEDTNRKLQQMVTPAPAETEREHAATD